jgi:hypothetical protein
VVELCWRRRGLESHALNRSNRGPQIELRSSYCLARFRQQKIDILTVAGACWNVQSTKSIRVIANFVELDRSAAHAGKRGLDLITM